ncbi:MAG: gamma-glutamyltransferase [Gammaproteobacteria bacterium]|nr:gamma-glutamyltransferase [Gammaproteobacteria bacterium]
MTQFTSRILFLLLLFSVIPVSTATAGPGQAAVASAHPLATEAGLEVLRQGGNAFDAAVAVSAALAVVEPSGSGLGGGGFWLIHRASDRREVMIDGRETAPAAAHADMYLDAGGNHVREKSLNGPLAAAIPGLPAALDHLSKQYGKLTLKETLGPAIRYAKDGFAVTGHYRKLVSFRREVLQRWPEGRRIFLKDGEVPPVGHLVVQKDLAETLTRIADMGRDGFYRGETATRLVEGAREHGGIWSLSDLEKYRVLERQPIHTRYHDIRITSASPPSSGGIVLSQALGILEHFDLGYRDSIQRKHLVIEAMRRAYRDRAVYLGDPDFVEIPVQRLLDGEYLEGLALSIDPERATDSSLLGLFELEQAGTSTTHFSVIDKDGNRVAATLSINLPFGSGFVPPGTGVLLNDEMDDFSSKPNTPNAYGLVGDEANRIAPGKRPLSSMTPTFVETDDKVGILGTPGGSRIISMVLLGVLEFADRRPPSAWVSRPRYHHQYLPDEVQFEQGGLTAEEQRALRQLGHKLNEKNRKYGNMQALMWYKPKNLLVGASDPRGEGSTRLTLH